MSYHRFHEPFINRNIPGLVKVASPYSAHIMYLPGPGRFKAGYLPLARFSAIAERVRRIVASLVDKAMELVAGDAFVVRTARVTLSIRSAGIKSIGCPSAKNAVGRSGRGRG